MRIFISHSSADFEFAKTLAGLLQKNGFATWYAPRDISPSADYSSEITSGIRASDAFIILLSDNSMGSTAVKNELEMAFFLHKKIVPVSIGFSWEADDIRFYIGRFQRLDISRDADGIDITGLIGALGQTSPTDVDGSRFVDGFGPEAQISKSLGHVYGIKDGGFRKPTFGLFYKTASDKQFLVTVNHSRDDREGFAVTNAALGRRSEDDFLSTFDADDSRIVESEDGRDLCAFPIPDDADSDDIVFWQFERVRPPRFLAPLFCPFYDFDPDPQFNPVPRVITFAGLISSRLPHNNFVVSFNGAYGLSGSPGFQENGGNIYVTGIYTGTPEVSHILDQRSPHISAEFRKWARFEFMLPFCVALEEV
jgi:hypothetical protein